MISLPKPCLVVLIGAAGAGKSTLAARLFAPEAILSSDALREVISGDAAEQGATKTAFAILHRELERRLAAGRTVIVDATSVTPFARRALLRRAAARGVPAIAIVLDLPPSTVLARNGARRGRVVPEAAVRAQLGDLDRSLRPGVLEAEGFAAIHRITDPAELDDFALEVGQGPAAPATPGRPRSA
jgi:protein phosphatase